MLGTFAPNLPQIVLFEKFFQSVRDAITERGVKFVLCRMVLCDQTSPGEDGH